MKTEYIDSSLAQTRVLLTELSQLWSEIGVRDTYTGLTE